MRSASSGVDGSSTQAAGKFAADFSTEYRVQRVIGDRHECLYLALALGSMRSAGDCTRPAESP